MYLVDYQFFVGTKNNVMSYLLHKVNLPLFTDVSPCQQEQTIKNHLVKVTLFLINRTINTLIYDTLINRTINTLIYDSKYIIVLVKIKQAMKYL